MRKRVVIASYDPKVRDRQASLFKGLEVDICAVVNGDEALKAAEEQAPDLMLIDPMLPRISGFDVSRKVRDEQPELPIIMLTSVYVGLAYRTEAVNRYGVTEYFEEPADQQNIRNSLCRHLELPDDRKRDQQKRPRHGEQTMRDAGKRSTRKRLEAILRETGVN